jgi:hypothetical protein
MTGHPMSSIDPELWDYVAGSGEWDGHWTYTGRAGTPCAGITMTLHVEPPGRESGSLAAHADPAPPG